MAVQKPVASKTLGPVEKSVQLQRVERVSLRYFVSITETLGRIEDRNIRTTETDQNGMLLFCDYEALVMQLSRLRRCFALLEWIPELKSTAIAARSKFDALLPGLKDIRDVLEHFDDYSTAKGQKATFDYDDVENFGVSRSSFFYLDRKLEIRFVREAILLSRTFFKSVQA
jgi:hypothetical protein